MHPDPDAHSSVVIACSCSAAAGPRPYRMADSRGVPEVDQGGDQQLPCGEGPRSVLACLPSPAEMGCGLVVRLPGATAQPRADPALLPVGARQGHRGPGATPRACGAAPPAPPAPPAAHRPCAAGGAAPAAPTGALAGVPGAARDAAALAPAHGPPALDPPNQRHRTACDLRGGAAAGRAARPRAPALGLPAHPRRAVAPWLAGVGQLDPAGAARPRP
jgi:hypothetical protein